MSSEPNQTAGSRKRDEVVSKDGQCRSFPKVPFLLQYVSNGNYYGRIRVNGKLIRESLKTDFWTTARLRLHDFLKKNRKEDGDRVKAAHFTEAVAWFKQDVDSNTAPKTASNAQRS